MPSDDEEAINAAALQSLIDEVNRGEAPDVESLLETMERGDHTLSIADLVPLLRAITLSHAARSGVLFCSASDLFDSQWEIPTVNDYNGITRDWETWTENLNNNDLKEVYEETRKQALMLTNTISQSKNSMKVSNVTPVRLCSHANSANYAEKAHLCPKNGVEQKSHTWLYVAAAVLGMPSTTRQDRTSLLRAICGSVAPDSNSVLATTGINRSPFNLLSFLEKEEWFDVHSGVLALPVMTAAGARDWNGTPYEIIISCNDVPGQTTADDIATRIGLGSTQPQFLHHATPEDVAKAASLLSQVVKASAYSLEFKEGPDKGRGALLWGRFRQQLLQARSGYAMVMTPREPNSLAGKVPVPVVVTTVPRGKIVAKINLGEMTPPVVNATPAYPDPLLLAYKSSNNWTRRFGFQLVAKAEPPEHPNQFDPPVTDVLFDNQFLISQHS